MNCSRVFINARFSFRFSFLHFLLFSCVFIFISFLVCSESEKEMGRDRSPKDPGRSSSLDEVEGMFSVCCFEISRDDPCLYALGNSVSSGQGNILCRRMPPY